MIEEIKRKVPKTYFQKFVEEHYIQNREKVRFIVNVLDSELLKFFPKGYRLGDNIPLDILPNRPMNLEFNEHEFAIDLCFDGPPVKCVIPYVDIIGVAVFRNGRWNAEVVMASTTLIRTENDGYIIMGKEINLDINLWELLSKTEDEVVEGKSKLYLVEN